MALGDLDVCWVHSDWSVIVTLRGVLVLAAYRGGVITLWWKKKNAYRFSSMQLAS